MNALHNPVEPPRPKHFWHKRRIYFVIGALLGIFCGSEHAPSFRSDLEKLISGLRLM